MNCLNVTESCHGDWIQSIYLGLAAASGGLLQPGWYWMKSMTKQSRYLTVPTKSSLCLTTSNEPRVQASMSWHRRKSELVSSLMTRTEIVFKMLVYLPFNHLMQLLAWENFIELFSVAHFLKSQGLIIW